ncbi:hypothetical protein [Enterococcus raffinosus]|uniref:Uncharacterized protein n=1 Tax=Enterococcus raffinosus TaxID=71452 RepID=A0AAW8T5F1_9ENTE|nr:hypothetical protein [Enterococcus raffinosus]MDT2522588.1 hypothetical protein [Enterococcus raffinosus]MDT2531187.1 hypothetical protein [Enterococcus raffinosus]MDT2533048.1 hypothetical protein [Enterococcus raffinosus]MDT2543769.1 hypothetical protein [Enterococcus raffinosus]MDT2555095.1 hypothetical protein [Enterococcus raffinosus]
MMILILLILIVGVLTGVRNQQKAKANATYWARINELEAQRKEQILATAIKKQLDDVDAKSDHDLKQAS